MLGARKMTPLASDPSANRRWHREMPKFELSLIENAFDFLQEAIDCLREGSPRKLKYSVLHLASAAELLLKARLSREHWSLIFKDPAKASEESFASGEFASADFQDVQDR